VDHGIIAILLINAISAILTLTITWLQQVYLFYAGTDAGTAWGVMLCTDVCTDPGMLVLGLINTGTLTGTNAYDCV